MTLDNRKIKRYVIIFVIIVLGIANREPLMIGVDYAWTYIKGVFGISDDAIYTEERAKFIMNAMAKNDEVELLTVFSEYSRANNADTLDNVKILAKEHGAPVSTFKGTVRERKEENDETFFVIRYNIETEKGKFVLHFIDIIKSPDPARVGVHLLQYIPSGDNRHLFTTLEMTGVYLP